MNKAVGRQRGGPMYQQLRQDLLARIRRGEFAPGDLLPSENQLRQQYEVSITTVRRALLELVKEGVIQRKVGVGTTVSPRVRRARITFVSIDYLGDAWRHVSSVMGEIVSGVGEYAWQHDTTLNMVGVEDDDAAAYLRDLVDERSSDGVLLRVANDIREEHLRILEEAGFPYVVIKRHIPGRKMNCVISDDVSGARMATDHLLELGYERIGFVCAKPHITLSQERLAGYRKALAESGVGSDDTLVRQEPYFTMEMGYQAVRSLLELPNPPGAVFVASDTMALGGYQAAWDLGLNIPEDVALVGYDDIPQASVLQPPLTTVRTSYYDFGLIATRLLLDIIEGKEVPPQQKVIRPRLIRRESSNEKGSTVAPTQDKADVAIERTEDAIRRGRLSGKTIVYEGAPENLLRRSQSMLEAEGAKIVHVDKATGPGGHRERATTLVCYFSLAHDLGESLESAIAQARNSAESMQEHGLETIVCVASLPNSKAAIGQVKYEAAKAGLKYIVRTLAEELKDRNVRANGLMLHSPTNSPYSESGQDDTATLLFLASDEARRLNGETLTLKDPVDTNAR